MWAYETTFYQIYPLGFCGAPRENVAPVAEDELSQAAGTASNPDAPIMKIAQWADYLQELGIGAVLINLRLSPIAMATTRAACAISTVAWVGTPTLPPYATRCTPMASAWCLMPSSTTSVAAFGPSAMCRSASGTRPTRTGSILALTEIPAMATAFGTRLGRPF